MLFAHLVMQVEVSPSKRAVFHLPTLFPQPLVLARTKFCHSGNQQTCTTGYGGGEGVRGEHQAAENCDFLSKYQKTALITSRASWKAAVKQWWDLGGKICQPVGVRRDGAIAKQKQSLSVHLSVPKFAALWTGQLLKSVCSWGRRCCRR